MAARDSREHEKDSYLSNFSVDYKKAFIKQQKEPIPDVNEGKLDEYIKSKFNICDQYYNDKWNHTSYPLFLHREYTYGGYGMSGMGAKCYKCSNGQIMIIKLILETHIPRRKFQDTAEGDTNDT